MVRGVAKMKKTILVVTLIGISVVCLMFAKARFFSTYVALDPDAEEVQSIVGEINLGIGKGSYDKILIFRGKDPLLVSSCTVPRQVWEQIVSKAKRGCLDQLWRGSKSYQIASRKNHWAVIG